MRNLVQHLAEVCSSSRMAEKLLIVPSHQIGRQILESLALSGTNVINCKSTTLFNLVKDHVKPLLVKNKLTHITDEVRNSVIEDLYVKFIFRKEGRYFGKLEPTFGIISALSNSINTLRIADISYNDLKKTQFISEEKFNAVRILLEGYEKYLLENDMVDDAAIYGLFLNSSPSELLTGKKFIILPEIAANPLQRKCLDVLFKGDYVVLVGETVQGLPYPRHFLSSSTISCQAFGRLSWAYQPSRMPDDLPKQEIGFFHAEGISSEVKEVLRLIHSKQLPFDAVEVACADYAAYAYHFFIEQHKHDIPTTFSDGIPCASTRPGKALLGLLDWIESDYSVTALRNLLASNVLAKKGVEDLSSNGMIRILRAAGIGWGRERYLPQLKTLYQKNAECGANGDEEKIDEWGWRKAEHIQQTSEFIAKLFLCIPAASPEKIVTKDLAAGLGKFCNLYCAKHSDLDGLASAALCSLLEDCGRSLQEERTQAEFIAHLRMQLQSLALNSSSPKPGHIHITSIGKAGYDARTVHFITGLDEHRFPEPSIEDPVLLDSERKAISSGLTLSTDKVSEHMYNMYSFLASLSGSMTLSFTSYDILENREVQPSSIFLGAYRAASGKKDLDYTRLKEELHEPVGFWGLKPIDETEWWLRSIFMMDGKALDGSKIAKAYPSVARGKQAIEMRNATEFSAYDGNVNIDPDLFDPRTNSKMVMSCSRIEKIAKCPFDYFVTEVLGLRPPDEIQFDPSRWLDAAQKGTLMHEIFEEFMCCVRGRNEKVNLARHKKLLLEIAERCIAAYREAVPPPSRHVFAEEKNKILGDLDIFLNMEHERPATEEPQYFELSFGIPKQEHNGIGTDQPIKISIGKNSFLLRGTIDRIDKTGDHQYQVMDYKTGSSRDFTSKGYFNKGTTIQHCLYSRAAEMLLRTNGDKKAMVTLSGYLFPTKKGNADQIMRQQDRPQQVDEVVNLLFDIVRHGAFLHSESGCFLCNDYHLCGNTKDHYALKSVESEDKKIQLLQTLSKYE